MLPLESIRRIDCHVHYVPTAMPNPLPRADGLGELPLMRIAQERLEHRPNPGLRGRTAAIRQLILQAPPPVVAKMLGYNPDHTARLIAEAGGTWTRYAARDHTR